MKTQEFEAQFENAWKGGRRQMIEYCGKLLLPGEDAAIVMTADRIEAVLDGVPAPANHKFKKFVARYENSIREATANEFRHFQSKIVILGRWHDIGPNQKDFEPYIVHKCDWDGNALNNKYDYEIFPFDGLGSGEGYYMNFRRDDQGVSARSHLTHFSEHITSRTGLSEQAAVRLGLPTGLVWYPPNGSNFPILATERSRPGRRSTGPVGTRQFA
ncbi:hypothetical protein GB927_033995 [Shinella sp. CPCC 100929]|uniref:Uncharacterized protein n=1 Tax=Shinella lacus TaxID=2654216 RepID=A0ABT1RIR6_9HYPH|nr:hypothetical protein [Shinella lacus]MCQ4635076.1 hypothetical protein [Shinella lacus]